MKLVHALLVLGLASLLLFVSSVARVHGRGRNRYTEEINGDTLLLHRPDRDASAFQRSALSASSDVVHIGVVGDLQYADRDDGWDYSKTHRRRYRRSLSVLRNAIRVWSGSRLVEYAINLGDSLDAANLAQNTTFSAAASLAEIMRSSGLRWIQQVGNHELYNFCSSSGGGVGNSSQTLVPNPIASVRAGGGLPSAVPVGDSSFVLLNLFSYAFSVLCTSMHCAEAREYLMKRNPNLAHGDMRPGKAVWLKGLTGLARRHTPLNGGLGTRQVQWLRDELRAARSHGKFVVLTSHVPFHPEAAEAENLMWDYRRILHVIETEGEGVVVLVAAGHDHQGGFALHRPSRRHVPPGGVGSAAFEEEHMLDGAAEEGLPFITFPSPLEAANEDCFATLTLTAYHDRAVVSVHGSTAASGRSFVTYRK